MYVERTLNILITLRYNGCFVCFIMHINTIYCGDSSYFILFFFIVLLQFIYVSSSLFIENINLLDYYDTRMVCKVLTTIPSFPTNFLLITHRML